MKKKLIIFTEEKVGEGHYQAAKAIEAVIKEKFSNQFTTKIFSGMSSVHKLIEACVVPLYFFMIHYCPWLWKWMYGKNKKSSFFQKYVFALKLNKLMEEEQPDYIVCTHVACVPALNEIKKKGKLFFKLIVVFTDYGFHPSFIQENIDYYFVAHQKVKNTLVKEYQVNSNQIFDFGIPLRPEFDRPIASIHENVILMKDKKKFHLLILGGATGHGPIERIIHLFHPLLLRQPLRITVVTGNNRRLYKRLNQIYYPHLHVFEYVKNMEILLSQADIVITKPGGLTAAEAIACGTPMLLINPIPGHEETNYRFLQELELALCVNDLEQIPDVISQMYGQKEQWENWKKWLKEQHTEHAALRIIETISLSSP
ncbi:MGDG synthase family glycosyltransferase [Bacillus horti]|uniref:Processive 1,2-diacylglycerol beta-glucosyltransferase n=1 Tax=Caldalkalibacillus horti TaxID=77523 RepID=A0ABT9W4E8_9BACI|nr:glycosyltransferase [Bacillus horti]MDQ0168113.1 processive 1,2-diacylglycerol beta-glucosyltransferase [Bacillus horti]